MSDGSISRTRAQIAAAIGAVCFTALASWVFVGDATSTDRAALLWIHRTFDATWLEPVMIAATDAGRLPAMTLSVTLVAIGLLITRRRVDALFLVLACVASALVNPVLKRVFDRTRPALWTSPAPEHSASFPSGHAMASCTLALALVVLTWDTRWRWPIAFACTAMTLIIGASRLYLGVHNPTDVVAGWAASTAVVALLVIAFARPRRAGVGR